MERIEIYTDILGKVILPTALITVLFSIVIMALVALWRNLKDF